MYVLAIDTSSPAVTAGVVLLDDGLSGEADDDQVTLAAERAPLAARGHGELLSPAIADCLDDAGLTPGDIGAVVAGVGPGPFTGLRVGIVTAAAFADAIGVRTYAVGSLDALAAACTDEPALLVATDARRSEVYWARYEFGEGVSQATVSRPSEVDTSGVSAVAGAGGELYQDVWPQLPCRPERYPDPLALVRLALVRIVDEAEGETLEPMYLRRPDAVVPGAPKAVLQ